MAQGIKKQSAGKDPKEELVDSLVEFVSKASEGSREQQKNREQIQKKLKDWEKDLRHLLETSNRLSDVNAESAELLAELEIRNQSLGELNRKLAEANANSVNMMVEIEEKNEILPKTNKELARAIAHAAELMAIIETKDEQITELNKSLSGANAGSAELVADPEPRMVEINELNSQLTREIEEREKIEENTLAFADWHMTGTILRNLVSNAIKFTPENGKVSVRAMQTEECVQVKVSDTGIGIKQEVIDKLFVIDQKVVTTGTANEKGTGLGLILCKELVEKNGGSITAKSEAGKGSTFSFTLPKTQ